MIGVYRIRNLVNDKSYIGLTVDIDRKISKDSNSLRSGQHFNRYLQAEWIKYGEKNFAFETLEGCSFDDLDAFKKKYIHKLNSMYGFSGYNLVDGGQRFRRFSAEVKNRMSTNRKGMKFSTSHVINLKKHQIWKARTSDSFKKASQTKAVRRTHCGEKNPNAHINNATAEKILLDLYNNVSKLIIANKYGVSMDTINGLMLGRTYVDVAVDLREAIKNKHKETIARKAAEILALYNNGLSQNSIAKRLNTSRNTIRRIVSQAGLNTKKHINQYVHTEVSK